MHDDGVILVLAALVVVIGVAVLLTVGLMAFWQQDLQTIRVGLGLLFLAAGGAVGYGLWRAADTKD